MAERDRLRARLARVAGELAEALSRLDDLKLPAGLDCCRAAMLGALRMHFHRAHPDRAALPTTAHGSPRPS